MTERSTPAPAPPCTAFPPLLVSFALEHLPSMRLRASGLYCHEWRFGGTEPQGESVRYSLMVLLGLQRARSAGRDVPDDPEELWARCIARRDSFSAGDVGLALWAATRGADGEIPGLLAQLDRLLPADADVDALVGMELAWLVIGLAEAARLDNAAVPAGRRLLAQLRERRAPSGLVYHDASRLRRRLPNFATEIYAVLAFAVAARSGLTVSHATGPTGDAVALADRLLDLQLDDGGWPWLFHADRGAVVEPYEVYSVHQDAMAPMALIELTDVTGDDRYLRAAVAGLAWSHGNNPLRADLFDPVAGFAHRSIRRTSPFDRLALLGRSGAAMLGRDGRVEAGRRLELNRSCRPYHLGWILEAWAGRDSLPEQLADA